MKTCAQIRQATDTRPAGKAGEWMFACAECSVPHSGQSCWETCGGGPCCCAPLLMTCDFCDIYLEHRREIAGMIAHNSGNNGVLHAVLPQPEISSHLQGGIRHMEKVQFNVPDLWADHHTLKVRDVLTRLDGVTDIVASSAFRMVSVSYDPAVIAPGAIMAALEEAGYPVATEGSGIMTQPVPMQDGRRDPAWTRLGMRQMKTDERDLKTKR